MPPKPRSNPPCLWIPGIGALFRAAYELKADKYRMQICVAGGAQFLDKTGFFNIGQRNYVHLTQLLNQHGLTIDAKDVGGLVSRTIHLHLDTGEVRMKSSGQSEETSCLEVMQALDNYINEIKTLPPAPRVLSQLLAAFERR